MERRHMTLPLLIGGATTSRQHTAVKIAPEYSAPVVHVLDASRAVDVVARLLNAAERGAFVDETRRVQEEIRQRHAERAERPLLPYAQAIANRPRIEWSRERVAVPSFLGRRVLEDVAIAELRPFIDWTFFFTAWGLKGRFPAVLDHPEHGRAARELYENATRLLDRIARDRLLRPRGVYGFWPASADGDDIVLFEDAARTVERARFPMLRQQESADGRPNRSLADYVAPRASGVADYIGAFAVTGGIGAADLVRVFERDHDDYHAIMVKALADRIAEAFAAWLHARARRDWGDDAAETLTPEEVVAEKHRGIRPAFGYPACPDHSEKRKLFDLLGARAVGLDLTESCAMTPAASVSGLYFAHPDAKYFTVGRIGRDQVESYARRKGVSIDEVERWLSSNLAYEVEAVGARG
jgi:5-methyltetrahydrofolate--homocysteine methyltransferase